MWPRNDWMKYVLSRKMVAAPGERFNYSSGLTLLLGGIIRNTTGVYADKFAEEHLFRPLGISNYTWYTRDDGTVNTFGGLVLTPRDMAKIGYLFLRHGNWNGRQILESSFIKRATSTQVPAEIKTKYFDLTGRYGYFWWTNGKTANRKRPWPSAPPKTYAAHGAGRNFIFVIPEWSMVIVRLSPAPGGHINVGSVKKGVWEEFFSRLKIAIE